MSLLEEELSPMAKRGMQLGAGGVGLAMGHAGAFGGGIKGVIDQGAEMGANMATRAGGHVGNSFKQTKEFYSPSEVANTGNAVHDANRNAEVASNDAADADDESGLGVLGPVGLGLAGAGAAALAAKKSPAFQAGKRGISQAGGMNIANKLGGLRRSLSGKK